MARAMKDSGIAWIGEIAEDFEVIKLKYLCDILDQYRSPITADQRNQDADVLYDYYGASGAIDKIDGYTIDDHVMLIGEDGANLRMRNLPLMYEVNGKAWINNHSHILKPKSEADFYYLFYALEALDLNTYITGSAQPKLSQESLKNIWIPIPQYDTQKKISSVIRKKCLDIDTLIEQTRASIEEYKRLKQAVITQAVTKGIRPNRPMKDSGIDWIGTIPEEWITTKVKYVSSLVTDGAHVSPETENGIYCFVSTVNIDNGKIDFESCLKTSESSYASLVSTGCKPLAGDVLISKDGTVGKTAIVKEDREFVVASSLVIIRPQYDRIMTEYLNYVLQSRIVQETLIVMMHGAGLKRVSVAKNANLLITLPPINEQHSIVEYLDEKTWKTNLLIQKKNQLMYNLETYKKSIIYEYVTGKQEVTT